MEEEEGFPPQRVNATNMLSLSQGIFFWQLVLLCQRYWIKIEVMDKSDTATFVIFDHYADICCKKKCCHNILEHVI